MATKAQINWDRSREGRWVVADEAYSELEVAEYADGIARKFGEALSPPISDDTVYRLARAGRNYQRLLEYDPEITAGLRKCLTDNYFEPLDEIAEGDAIEWLCQAREERWKIEKFRAEISEHKGVEVDWEKEARSIDRKYIHFVAFGMEQKQVAKIQRAARLLRGRILEMVDGEEPHAPMFAEAVE